jgi:hypothetical protein
MRILKNRIDESFIARRERGPSTAGQTIMISGEWASGRKFVSSLLEGAEARLKERHGPMSAAQNSSRSGVKGGGTRCAIPHRAASI